MIIIKYIDIPNIKYQVIGIIASVIILGMLKKIKRKPKRKEVNKGNEMCSMQWLTAEDAKNILGIDISNNDDDKRCEDNKSK